MTKAPGEGMIPSTKARQRGSPARVLAILAWGAPLLRLLAEVYACTRFDLRRS